MLKYLVEKGANVNIVTYEGDTPLHTAVSIGNIEAVKYLLKNGAKIDAVTKNIDRAGTTPFLLAVKTNNVEVFKLMVGKKADDNFKNGKNHEALFYAIKNKSIDIVKYLIEYGVDVNTTNKKGDTPVIEAIRSQNVAILKFLVEKGGDINTFIKYKKTKLYYSLLGHRNPKTFKLLFSMAMCIGVLYPSVTFTSAPLLTRYFITS